MHKILKYQSPPFGLYTQDPTLELINEIFKKQNKVSDNLNNTHNSSMQQINSSAALSGVIFPKSFKEFTIGNGLAKTRDINLKNALKGDVTSLVASGVNAAVEPAIQLLGGKEADKITGGEQIFSKVADKAMGIGFNPALMAATGGLSGIIAGTLKGADLLNRYAGSTTKEQLTSGLTSTGYTTQIEPLANTKLTGLATLQGKHNKINAKIDKANKTNILQAATSQSALANINAANTQGVQQANYNSLLGLNSTKTILAKKGAKINPAKLRTIAKKAKKPMKAQEGSPVNSLLMMQEGGKFNVIPEGALHARKHNLPEDIAEQVTPKGIPVITYDEEDKITQHAEIEHSEIIFSSDVTKQLEEWYGKYKNSEDAEAKAQLELECGQLLVYEILENTEDNVGLIEQV